MGTKTFIRAFLKIRTGVLALVAAVCVILPLPNTAHAACSTPSGVEGQVVYNSTYKVVQFCNGTDWMSMGGGGGGAGVTDGDKGDISVSGSGANWLIDDDALDFTEFSDAMTLDASTRITVSGSNILTITNTGTANSLVVEDQASDTSPFVIDAAGNVAIGATSVTAGTALDVTGKATANSVIYKSVTSTAAPVTGSSMWSTNGTDVWRLTGSLGLGTASPADSIHVQKDGSATLGLHAYGNSSVAAGLTFRHTDGTFASQTNTKNAFSLGNIIWQGNGATGLFSGSAAKIHAVATANWTDTSAPTDLVFSTRAASTAGSSDERMRIMSDGAVGIGTSTPTLAKLQVHGMVGNTTAIFGGDGKGVSMITSSPSIGFNTYYDGGWKAINTGYGAFIQHTSSGDLTFRNAPTVTGQGTAQTMTEQMRLYNNGMLQIMTDTDATLGNNTGALVLGSQSSTNLVLDVNEIQARNNGAAAELNIQNLGGVLRLGPDAGSSYSFEMGGSSGSYIARFINADNSSGTDGVIIQAGPNSNPTTGSNYIRMRDGDGDDIGGIQGNGSGGISVQTTSDRRIKRNIVNTAQTLDTLMRVRVVDYNPLDSDMLVTGFIAQELYEVYPNAVTKPEDETKDKWTVDYASVTPLIVKAVQDQQKEIVALKAQNADLLKRLEALEAKQ